VNPIVLIFPVFAVTIFAEALIARRRGLNIYSAADSLTSMQFGVLSQVVGTFSAIATLAIYAAVWTPSSMFSWSFSEPLTWIIAFVLFDFFFYWEHRFNHEINLLWAGHVVHHSSEYFNLSTALRQSFMSAALGWIFYLPMAFMGIPLVVYAIVGTINLLYQYWVHTEMIGRLGFLDRVLVTPSNHRVHHGQNDYCINKNYGAFLLIWDRMFGTYAEERADEPVIYGIRKPLAQFNSVWGNLHYYREIWIRIRSAVGLWAKCFQLIAPPTEPLSHSSFDAANFKKYAPFVAGATTWYVAAQFMTSTLAAVYFLSKFRFMSLAESAWFAAAILASAATQGLLLSGHRRARIAEWLRIFALVFSIALVLLSKERSMSDVSLIALTIVALTSGAWFSCIGRSVSPLRTPA
jgi:sterol desaturase/sphingolipid hydroxylase (fatty acid hydroxylase superfamily)